MAPWVDEEEGVPLGGSGRGWPLWWFRKGVAPWVDEEGGGAGLVERGEGLKKGGITQRRD